MITTDVSRRLCGIVLAGGDGKRLKGFSQRLFRTGLPKQYLKITGERSLLEDTIRRVEKLIPPHRLYTVVNKNHLDHAEVRRQISKRPADTVVIQPKNKETAPGLLLPLAYVCRKYPESVIAVFPSDHFIREEELFMRYIDSAAQAVKRQPSRIFMLGIEPSAPQPEYGYIVPGSVVGSLEPHGAREILRFIEKPNAQMARDLKATGALWNTMIMVFKPGTLLGLIQKISPELHATFQFISGIIGSDGVADRLEEIYADLKPVNLSRDVMESIARSHRGSLGVLPVKGVYWSDWGSAERIMNSLKKLGHHRRASWMHRKLHEDRMPASP